MSNPVKSSYPKSKIHLPSSYRSGPSGSLGRNRVLPEGASKPSLSLGVKQEPLQSGYEQNIEKVRRPQFGHFRQWIYRNPRKFHIISLTIGLTIFFSRPLYDIFLRERIEGPLPVRTEKKNKQ